MQRCKKEIKNKEMGSIKACLLGIGTAYALYAITKKREDGTSLLDDLLNDPAFFMKRASEYAIAEAVHAVEQYIGQISGGVIPRRCLLRFQFPVAAP